MEPNRRFETIQKSTKTLQIPSEDSGSSKSRKSSFSDCSSPMHLSSFSPNSQKILETQGKMLKILQAQVDELQAIVFEGRSRNDTKNANFGFVTPKKTICPFQVVQKDFSGSNYEENIEGHEWVEEKEDFVKSHTKVCDLQDENKGKGKNEFLENFEKSSNVWKAGNLGNFYFDLPKIEYQSLSESESDDEIDAVERRYLCKFLDFNHTLK
jgi:hypothetical protein